MTIVSLCILIIVVGILLWLATTYLPLPEPIKKILTAVVVVMLVLVALQTFGVLGSVNHLRLH